MFVVESPSSRLLFNSPNADMGPYVEPIPASAFVYLLGKLKAGCLTNINASIEEVR